VLRFFIVIMHHFDDLLGNADGEKKQTSIHVQLMIGGAMDKLMKTHKLFLIASAVATIALPLSSYATKHVVTFGGCLGQHFCPSSFCANIGDTVQWHGSFVKYTLNATLIPIGAEGFYNDSGTSYSYVVKVGGVYHYGSTDTKMSGSFNVHCKDSTSINPKTISTTIDNPLAKSRMSGGHALINLNMSTNELVTVSILTLKGEKLATILNDILEPGLHSIPLNNISAGNYIVNLSVGSKKMTIKTFVAR
jgi:hypothetical protein